MTKGKILITGAGGLVGTRLIEHLLRNEYEVKILSRDRVGFNNMEVFLWDIQKMEIDSNCVADVDMIIHLAGEPIAGKRWTDRQKRMLVQSRVDSTILLAKALKETPNRVQRVISASAIGYYGNRADEVLTEDSAAGDGFLSDCCVLWEDATNHIKALNIPVNILRLGIVLDRNKGSLPVMAKPIKLMAGAPLGNGKQWVSWIHQADLVSLIHHCMERKAENVIFNAVSPHPVTNDTLTRAIAKKLHRPVWPVNVPEFALRAVLGEMADVVLTSTNVSAQKIISDDFTFTFLHLEDALSNIYGQS
ncbi:MAG: TIGR01777 family protein [Chitinophagaceae bacterium]|nr:MAG: TIGR01777 family protein [Chitinophagaceae bacterium]